MDHLQGLDAAHLVLQIKALQKEKIDLENALEQEAESAVNKLNKQKQKLEDDNHVLEAQLQHCPAHHKLILQLSDEVIQLKELLAAKGLALNLLACFPFHEL